MEYDIVSTEQAEIIVVDGQLLCPPMDGESVKILKEADKPITMAQLSDYLSNISWGLRHVGCGHHQIINQYGENTEYCATSGLKKDEAGKFSIEDVKVEVKGTIFGKNGSGGIYIDLYNCVIELSEGCIWIYPTGKNSGISIHLYNFDKPLTPEEELINSFPKDYMIKLVCDNCKNIVNESHHFSAYKIRKDWSTIVMGRGLNTPPCKKCKNTTYPDLNMSNEIKIYRVSTNRVVKFETIKKEAMIYDAKMSEFLNN